MDAQQKEQVGLFRFGLIFPLLDERLQYGDITRLLKEISAREYDIPYSKRRTVSVPTLYNWLNAYRQRRSIEDLYPSDRADKGQRRNPLSAPLRRKTRLNYVPTLFRGRDPRHRQAIAIIPSSWSTNGAV